LGTVGASVEVGTEALAGDAHAMLTATGLSTLLLQQRCLFERYDAVFALPFVHHSVCVPAELLLICSGGVTLSTNETDSTHAFPGLADTIGGTHCGITRNIRSTDGTTETGVASALTIMASAMSATVFRAGQDDLNLTHASSVSKVALTDTQLTRSMAAARVGAPVQQRTRYQGATVGTNPAWFADARIIDADTVEHAAVGTALVGSSRGLGELIHLQCSTSVSQYTAIIPHPAINAVAQAVRVAVTVIRAVVEASHLRLAERTDESRVTEALSQVTVAVAITVLHTGS